ncbi:PAS domain-containing protein [Chitinophaga skermanii]|uniref:PAS domain-containing protein n=1 Tax=Chitinophaga skermanii TaxID=331697 RepID=A0A327QV79_9BACT|nr:LuxR C-terminal-related transcriptional regulator [Chitinophaga skermanii]RAJ08586.1 PAS domain-containing protein [Chitinophaga skermanii]
MDVLLLGELKKLWQSLAKHVLPGEFDFKFDVQQHLLNIFHVEEYYYFIFNTGTGTLEFVSPQVSNVLGYTAEEFDSMQFLRCIHPDDQFWFLNFQNMIAEFFMNLPPGKVMHYKIRSDFRLRKKDGEYVRILSQVTVLQTNEIGSLLRGFGVHTDITHLKKDGRPMLSFIGMNGEPSYIDVEVKPVFLSFKELISPREKQILQLLIQGKTSKEIAIALGNTKQTVDKQRKNMLVKTNTKSSAELVVKAIREGWI